MFAGHNNCQYHESSCSLYGMVKRRKIQLHLFTCLVSNITYLGYRNFQALVKYSQQAGAISVTGLHFRDEIMYTPLIVCIRSVE